MRIYRVLALWLRRALFVVCGVLMADGLATLRDADADACMWMSLVVR